MQIKELYMDWAANKAMVVDEAGQCRLAKEITLVSSMKPLTIQWTSEAARYIRSHPQWIIAGWKFMAHLTDRDAKLRIA